MKAALLREAIAEPPKVLTPDGNLLELRHLASSQAVATAFGAGYNELGALWLDADRYGLFIGIQGVFEWQRNALVVLLDRDFGASTGPATMSGAFSDASGRADAIISSLSLSDPGVAGFGADYALVTWGGSDPKLDELLDDAGLRGLHPPRGQPNDLGWHAAAINFGEKIRTKDGPAMPRAGEGFEAFVPWEAIYPELGGMVPLTATVAISAILVNDDGGYTSNQALPPFASTRLTNPGRTVTPLPGVVRFMVDSNGDAIGDGDRAPEVMLPQ
jgi:hypothetical protein